MGETNMTPAEEAAWVAMAKDGSLRRILSTDLGTTGYHRELARRAALVQAR